MSATLLDANVLIALLWPAHEHHEAAHRWFAATGRRRWATCPLTELAFVRIVSNPAFSTDALRPADAAALLARNLAHPRHEFWPDDIPMSTDLVTPARSLRGHRQVIDAYLLALATKRRGTLATFDAGIRAIAPATRAGAVDVVPVR